jgi:hypothetical protein
MKKALLWIKDYWWIPAFILAIVLGWVVFRKRGNPFVQTRRELDAIDAGRRARELEARLGAEKAREMVEKEHAVALKSLDAEKAAKAKELRNDPVALAKFLVRAGSGNLPL